jgi:hypothetical protein
MRTAWSPGSCQHLVERTEHRRAAELFSESARRGEIHVGDPDEVSLGHATCDQPRMDRPHPAGREPFALRHGERGRGGCVYNRHAPISTQ